MPRNERICFSGSLRAIEPAPGDNEVHHERQQREQCPVAVYQDEHDGQRRGAGQNWSSDWDCANVPRAGTAGAS